MSTMLKSLRVAAAATMQRIEADAKRAPGSLRPLLSHIAENLFDPDLDANQLKIACGIRNNSVPLLFHNVLGLPPYGYIENCRMEIACRLLSGTDAKLWQIAQVLGYSSLQTFSRAFLRWGGCRPSAFRRQGAAALQKGDSPPVVVEATVTSNSSLDSSKDEKALYDFERQCAEDDVWPAISDKPLDEAQRMLHCYQFRTSALFEVLLQKARIEGRKDRQRGVEWNQLALACLDGADLVFGDRIHELRAKGWAWLGNARRLALDFPGAEGCFVRAYRELTVPCDHRNPSILGEVLLLEGTLRMIQRSLEEASDLMTRAVGIFAVTADQARHIQVICQRSSCYVYANRLEEATEDLQTALGLCQDDPTMRGLIHLNFADIGVRSGDAESAKEHLALHREALKKSEDGNPMNQPLVLWLEANIEHLRHRPETAAQGYLSANRAYKEIGDDLHASLVTLDLAILFAEHQKYAEVASVTADIAPTLAKYRLGDETRESLRLLQEATRHMVVEEAVLQRLRAALQRDPLAAMGAPSS